MIVLSSQTILDASSAKAAGAVTVLDQHAFTYTGGPWDSFGVVGALNGDTRFTWAPNASWSYTFTGVQAKIYGSKFYNSGKAAISFDGGAETIVDLFALSSQHQTNYYSTPLLPNGVHTLRVRNTGTKNDLSRGYSVHADRLDVSTTTAPPGSPHVVYRDGGLAPGWDNWSWNTAVNLNLNKDNGAVQPGTNIPPRAIGRSAISVRHTTGDAALNLHSDAGVPVSGLDALTFYLRTDPGSSVSLAVALLDENWRVSGRVVPLVKVPNGPVDRWHESTFRRYDLRLVDDFAFAGRTITGIQIVNRSGGASPAYYVDEVVLNPRLSDGDCGIPAPQGGLEVRPENDIANHQPAGGLPTDPGDMFGDGEFLFEREYYPKIDGNCRGTTEQIIEWAATKWGFADRPSVVGGPALNRLDAVKAQAVVESDWFQNVQGDFLCGAARPNGIGAGWSAIGLVNKVCDGANDNWGNSFPRSLSSTALAFDYAFAGIRAHHDCKIHWTCQRGMSSLTGQLRVNAALRAWVCGCGPSVVSAGADVYLAKLLSIEAAKPWVNDAAWRAMRW
jgi:hypothetical protein